MIHGALNWRSSGRNCVGCKKGSATNDKVPAHLLRLFGIHQRFRRYVPRHDYLASPSNPIADAASETSTYLPAKLRGDFCLDLCLAQEEATKKGVSAGRAAAGDDTAWGQWLKLATELAFGPFLEAIEDKIPILQWVSQAHPWHDDSRKTSYRLSKMISAWKKEDPPPNRVKPIPVQVLRSIAYLARDSNRDFNKATMDMIMIAFYFMLRPGEYTVDGSAEESMPFRLTDVQLFIRQTRIDLFMATDEARIRCATSASLAFTDRKMVSTAKSSASDAAAMPSSASPQSLCLRAHNTDPTTLLATVCTTPRKVMHSVSPTPCGKRSAPLDCHWVSSQTTSPCAHCCARREPMRS
ncbi:hypothetical protein THAOC_02391 [Thalassiosira oceanica]|uniref:Uncharacterized protein n=1 Tax=Thalassiosira oceanica TaxID=159749 RepID=K0TFP3_THAOC|nr:hypothetical protein THAOC_02391 [Thalassiosira oceanica]|eukprot:EJK75874.1 hypothetical protein THAOC_02391 [Thalassiosira oceanica]